MKVILHIGADKCGSTAIQKTLFHNAALLRERGISYLAGEFVLAHDGTICRVDNGERIIDCDKLRERLEIATGRESKILILSFEGFHTVSQRSLLEVREVLKNHEVQIVYYIREQADYVNSALLQRAKTQCEAEMALRVYRGGWTGFLGHNYAGILFIWRSAFPGSEITVRVFDRDSLVDGDVVKDFFVCAGISHDGLQVDSQVINTSITLETAVALESMSALGLVEKDQGSVAIGFGAAIGGCSKLISRTHSWIIRVRNLRCNISLSRRYFKRLLPFRYKSMGRGTFDQARVLEILKQTGKQLSHISVNEGSTVRQEQMSFLSQGFVLDEKGVALHKGENQLLIRCGNWHAAELWNQLLIAFKFSSSSAGIQVDIWGQRMTVSEERAVEFTVSLSETSILIPVTVTIECEEAGNYLEDILISFR